MSYTWTQTCSCGSHLTCRVSTLALYVTSSPSIPMPNWCHRRRRRTEKNDAKRLERKWTSSSKLISSLKSGTLPGLQTLSWSKRPLANGEYAPTTPILTWRVPRMHTDVAPCGACRPLIFFINGVLCNLKMNGSGMEKEERWSGMSLQEENESRRSSPP